MSYNSATFLSLSPMMGNLSWLPLISSMSLIQPPWLSTVLALKPISFTPRFVNSGSSFANAPNSVVHLPMFSHTPAQPSRRAELTPECSLRDGKRERPMNRQ